MPKSFSNSILTFIKLLASKTVAIKLSLTLSYQFLFGICMKEYKYLRYFKQ